MATAEFQHSCMYNIEFYLFKADCMPYVLYIHLIVIIYYKIRLLEPVGSVPPKVNSHAKFDELTIANGATLSILCPAQSFPVPSHR